MTWVIRRTPRSRRGRPVFLLDTRVASARWGHTSENGPPPSSVRFPWKDDAERYIAERQDELAIYKDLFFVEAVADGSVEE